MKCAQGLVLGTVQLGQPYGIASPGMPSAADSAAILDAAWDAGVRTLDTALAYGLSVSRIGDWIDRTGRAPQVICKIAPGDSGDAVTAIDAVLAGLRVGRVHGIMFHRGADFLDPAARAAVQAARAAGRIDRIGVSVYEVDELQAVLAAGGADYLQVPASLVNRRVITAPGLAAARAAGVIVHGRSAFCQGLLFLDPATVPPALAGVTDFLALLRRHCPTPRAIAALALAAALDEPMLDACVVGVDRAGQMVELVDCLADPVDPAVIDRVRSAAAALDPALFDPRHWASAGPRAA